MTQDIFGTGTASADEVRSEKARRAVQAFRAMQAGLSGYAQALTQNKSIQVVLAEGEPRTDGRKIYFKPPIELGDLKPHKRALCDKRDGHTMVQLCDACRVRETVLISIYHEVAHIVYGTFAEPSDDHKLKAVERAVEEAPGKYADKIREAWAKVPDYKKKDYLNLSSLISPFLPTLVNAIEDARVDEAMFKARRGTKVMFDAMAKSVFADGIQMDDGTFSKWADRPLNSQIIIGVFAAACRYDFTGWFDPDVEKALRDKKLNELIDRIETLRSSEGSYNLAFPLLARLRELGFCRNPEEEPEEDEPEAGEDPGDDQGEGESDDSDPDPADADGEEPKEGAEEPESGDGDPSDDGADDGEPEGDETPGDRVQDPSDGADEGEDASGGESEGDEPADSGDASGRGEEGDGDGESASESEEDDSGDSVPDSGSEPNNTGDPGSGGSAQSDSDSDSNRGGDQDDDQGGEGSSGGDDDLRSGGPGNEVRDEAEDEGPTEPQSGEDGGDEPQESEADGDSGDSEPVEGEAVDETDADTDGESESSSDSSGTDPQEQGDDADGISDGARYGDGEPDNVEGDDLSADEGDSSDDEGDSEPADPVDTGEYTDEGAIEDKAKNYGTAEDAMSDFKVFTLHEDPPESIDSGTTKAEEADEKAVERAIIQSLYFEKPSANITGVRVHRFGVPTYTEGKHVRGAWDAAEMYGNSKQYEAGLQEIGVRIDLNIPEQVLGPALGEMRRAFADNQRADMQRHLKSGRVNNKVLGKRAWNGDPRLFQKKRIPGKKNYAVVLGIDISGSTMGLNISLAKRAAMAQAELCHRLGVDFAVYAHTAQGTTSYGDDLWLDMYEIKRFDEPWNPDTKKALADVSSLAENLDGHGLEYYRKVVERHTATDKIILYYSDGKMPAANHDEELEILQREIKYCKSHNITLLGVGIRTNSPQRHGLDTVRVDKDSDISKVVRHLESALLHNR